MALSSSQLAVLFLLGFCFVLCVTGCVAPYWEYKDVLVPGSSEDVSIDVGLWFACAKSPGQNYDRCLSLPWNLNSELVEDDTYFKAVRVLMASSMLFQIICVSVSVLNCCKKLLRNSINLECIVGTLGGVAGLAGIATYAVFSNARYHPFSDELHPADKDIHLLKGFAFYLSGAGSGALVLVAVVGLCVPGRRETCVKSRIARVRGYSNSSFSMESRFRDAKAPMGDARDFL